MPPGAVPDTVPGHHHLDFGSGPARAHAPGISQAQMLHRARHPRQERRAAAENRAWLATHGILALNLVSSPGSGKTSLLVRTLQLLGGRVPAAVIEGDQQTSSTPSASAPPACRRCRSTPARAATSTPT